MSEPFPKSCPKCGAEYEVKTYKVPVKGEESFTCTCGHELAKWKGTTGAEYTQKKPGKA